MLKAIQSAALVAQYFLLFLLRRKQMHLNLRLRVFLAHCLKPCLVLKRYSVMIAWARSFTWINVFPSMAAIPDYSQVAHHCP